MSVWIGFIHAAMKALYATLSCGLVMFGCGGSDGLGLPDGAKRVFVTKNQYSGNMNGNPDGVCQIAADSASLGGQWKAWASQAGNNAINKITGEGSWFDLTGKKIFANHAALELFPGAALKIDETGNEVFGGDVWTGTSLGGKLARSCLNWTSALDTEPGTAGFIGRLDSFWTETSNTQLCVNSAHLYCFEI
jgi:hypothetical protein